MRYFYFGIVVLALCLGSRILGEEMKNPIIINNDKSGNFSIQHSPAAKKTWTVTNDSLGPGADTIPGSLLWAEHKADSAPGFNKIAFGISGTFPICVNLYDSTSLDGTGHSVIISRVVIGPESNNVEVTGIVVNEAGVWIEIGSNNVEVTGIVVDGSATTVGIKIRRGYHITISDNVICNCSQGIYVKGEDIDILNNFIGTDVTGMNRGGGNEVGIYCGKGASNINISGNVISGNSESTLSDGTGIFFAIYPGNSYTISNNLIGLNADGTDTLSNTGYGIVGEGTGPVSLETCYITITDNYIAGNLKDGIRLWRGEIGYHNYNCPIDCLIKNNYIGTDASGTQALGNKQNGITIDLGESEKLKLSIKENLVSANENDGIAFYCAVDSAVITDNIIGLNIQGDSALGNGGNGISGSFRESHIKDNYIAGNQLKGINCVPGESNFISGNYIGTDMDGINPIHNQTGGIYFYYIQSKYNKIEANIIADGIIMTFSGDSNSVINNYIGTNGGSIFGKDSTDGIHIESTNHTKICSNVIGGNGQDGIRLVNAQETEIEENEIIGNKEYGVRVTGQVDSIYLTNVVIRNNKVGIKTYNPFGSQHKLLIKGTNNQIIENTEGGIIGAGDIEIEVIEVCDNGGRGILANSGGVCINSNPSGGPVYPDSISRVNNNSSGGIRADNGFVRAYFLEVNNNGQFPIDPIKDGHGISAGYGVSLFNSKVLNNERGGIYTWISGGVQIMGTDNQVSGNKEDGIYATDDINIGQGVIEVCDNGGLGIFTEDGEKVLINNIGYGPPAYPDSISKVNNNGGGGIRADNGFVKANFLEVINNGISPFDPIKDGHGIYAGYGVSLFNSKILNNERGGIYSKISGNVTIRGDNNQVSGNKEDGIYAIGDINIGQGVIEVCDNGGLGIFTEDGEKVLINNIGYGPPAYPNSISKVNNNGSGGIRIDNGFVKANFLEVNNNGHQSPLDPIKDGHGIFTGSAGAICRGKICHNEKYGIVTGDTLQLYQTKIYNNGLGGILFTQDSKRTKSYSEIFANKDESFTINGSMIFANDGDGIRFEGGTPPTIYQNNIFDNAGFGLNNLSSSATLNAQNNWWGDSSGPGGVGSGSGDEVSENVDFTNWLTELVALVSFTEDTILIPSGGTDTAYCYLQNWSNLDDILDVSVTADSTSWLIDPTAFTVALEDSMGGMAMIGIQVPAGTSVDVTNKVKITATSQNDPTVTCTDSFLVVTYHRYLTHIEVSPDTVFLNEDLRRQFTAQGYDSIGSPIDIEVIWTATNGTIDSSGYYTAGSDTGTFAVTAEDTATGIQGSAVVRILPLLALIKVSPDFVVLELGQNQQFTAQGYDSLDNLVDVRPIWHTTGGMINSSGLYTASGDTGNYYVITEDPLSHLSDTAEVRINLASVEEEKLLPPAFSLSQNYPNPFNLVATIKFGVKRQCRVVLKVYDVSGREVVKLVDGMREPGFYEVKLDARELSSGIYFCRIKMGNFKTVRKMTIVK
ncbi:right-handed parallel beta-helix repeat-containing protein [candidate division WOR-3 bacterium]|nr:right-handed parallel beta-helix repeat-containing protein [candidate division WOR-3 bacterium]